MADTEFLRETKVNRSAYAVTYAERTAIYLGTCDEHQRPVRFDTTQEGRFGHEERRMIPCPVNGHMIQGERLSAVVTNLECDGACRSARKASCSCGCGGVNHGNTWTRGALLSNREAVESELARYRAEVAKITEKREQRAAAKTDKQRRDFEAWAVENAVAVEWLGAVDLTQEPSNFVEDMVRKVRRGEILSDNMIAAVERVMADRERKARRDAEREAQKAEARPVPVGKGVQIAGKIVKVTCREGYMPGTAEVKATVACDGFLVWVTLPRAVETWVRENRSKELFDGWKPSYHADYDGASRRWTGILRGTSLSFSAAVERSDRDASFGFAKRPSRVEFTVPEPEITTELEAS